MDKRLKIAENKLNYWLRCAKDIALSTNSQEALELYNSILKKATLGIPIKDGVRCKESINLEETLKIIFVRPSDSNLHAIYHNFIYKTKYISSFYPSQRAIFIREKDKVTKLWKGLILLHEACHIKKEDNNKNSVEEEREVFEFEIGLLKIIGKRDYEEVVCSLMNSIEKDFNKDSLIAQYKTPVYDTRLNRIFGRPLSRREKDLRMTPIFTDSAFRVIDKKFTKPESDREKNLLLRAIYENQIN